MACRADILLLRLFYPSNNGSRQPLTVNLHCISIRSIGAVCSRGYRHPGQSIACLVPLLLQARNHLFGRVIVVEGSAELLPRLGQLLLQLKCLEDERIPFGLERGQEGGDGGVGWWPGSHHARLLELD